MEVGGYYDFLCLVFCYILLLMKNRKNTLDSGAVRCLVYQIPDDNDIYYATALEFNLTVSADSDDVALLELREQMKEYIVTAREKNAPQILNQEVDEGLERVWLSVVHNEKQEDGLSHLIPLLAATTPITVAVSV